MKNIKLRTLNNSKNNSNFREKIILLRTDLNSNVINKKVLLSERIKAASETIKFLKKKKAKIVVIAHQGNPGKSDFLGLKQHSVLLNKFTKIKFVQDILGRKTEKAIQELKLGEALLLENIRFEKDEFKPEKKNNKLMKLIEMADLYVNDAFSVCHRNHSSMVLFPKYLKSYAGLLLEKEVNALKKINIKNCLYILGGAKPKDNIKLFKPNRKILACGLFGQLCLIAKGKNLGAQNKYLEKEIKGYKDVIRKLKQKLKIVQIKTPLDFAIKINGRRKEILLEEFPSNYEIFDIGKNTMELYEKELKKKKINSIFMKGPAGFCADKKFCKGTFHILKSISNSKSFSLIGGGHLSDAIEKSKIQKSKFGHISLSGGALLNYISGEKLPGLEALKIK